MVMELNHYMHLYAISYLLIYEFSKFVGWTEK